MLTLGLTSFLVMLILLYPIQISGWSQGQNQRAKPADLNDLVRLKTHAQNEAIETFDYAHSPWRLEIEVIERLQRNTGVGVIPLVEHLIECEKDLATLKREYENRSATARGASLTLVYMPALMWTIGVAIGVDVLGFIFTSIGFAVAIVGFSLISLSRLILHKLSNIALTKPGQKIQKTFSNNISALIGFTAIFAFQTNYFGFVVGILAATLIHNFWQFVANQDEELERFIKRDKQHFQILAMACLIDSGLPWTKALSYLDDSDLNLISKRIEMGFSPQEAFAPSDSWQEVGNLISESIQKGTKLADDLKSIATEYKNQSLAYRIQYCEKIAGRLVIPVNLLQIPAFILLGLVPLVAPLFTQTLGSFHI
jgi:hypothetical protein